MKKETFIIYLYLIKNTIKLFNLNNQTVLPTEIVQKSILQKINHN